MSYSSGKVIQLELILAEMVQNMALYWWEDIEDIAIQLQAARMCEDIDQSTLTKIYNEQEHNT